MLKYYGLTLKRVFNGFRDNELRDWSHAIKQKLRGGKHHRRQAKLRSTTEAQSANGGLLVQKQKTELETKECGT